MKIEFKINGNIEMHVVPENEEDGYLLKMLATRASDKGGVAKLISTDMNIFNDGWNRVVVSVEKNPGKPE